jgi:hypothetical protein
LAVLAPTGRRARLADLIRQLPKDLVVTWRDERKIATG